MNSNSGIIVHGWVCGRTRDAFMGKLNSVKIPKDESNYTVGSNSMEETDQLRSTPTESLKPVAAGDDFGMQSYDDLGDCFISC